MRAISLAGTLRLFGPLGSDIDEQNALTTNKHILN